MTERKKSVLNDKGFTLVETLGSLAVIMVLLVVCLTLFGSVSALWRDTAGEYDDLQNVSLAMSTLTKEMSGAFRIYAASERELRYQTVDGKTRSLHYNLQDQTLALYDILDPDKFTDAINPENVQDRDLYYAKAADLAHRVKNNPGGTLPAFAVLDANRQPLPLYTHLSNGERIIIAVTFESSEQKTVGRRAQTYETFECHVKLIKKLP